MCGKTNNLRCAHAKSACPDGSDVHTQTKRVAPHVRDGHRCGLVSGGGVGEGVWSGLWRGVGEGERPSDVIHLSAKGILSNISSSKGSWSVLMRHLRVASIALSTCSHAELALPLCSSVGTSAETHMIGVQSAISSDCTVAPHLCAAAGRTAVRIGILRDVLCKSSTPGCLSFSVAKQRIGMNY